MADDVIWTVTGEFMVCLPEGWTPACAMHLPVLVRRCFRHGVAPTVQRGGGAPCMVETPHPDPHSPAPYDGAGCPRPLTGLCLTGTCDHD